MSRNAKTPIRDRPLTSHLCGPVREEREVELTHREFTVRVTRVVDEPREIALLSTVHVDAAVQLHDVEVVIIRAVLSLQSHAILARGGEKGRDRERSAQRRGVADLHLSLRDDLAHIFDHEGPPRHVFQGSQAPAHGTFLRCGQ
jgi:hypothetical protein